MIKDTLKLLILFTGIIFISCANNKQDKISEPDKVSGYSFGEEKNFLFRQACILSNFFQ